jgi:hypothetical protein
MPRNIEGKHPLIPHRQAVSNPFESRNRSAGRHESPRPPATPSRRVRTPEISMIPHPRNMCAIRRPSS